jgi:hypothetical protein
MGQTTTLQATAWSQNSDITSTVGPFTWSAANSSVVAITPLMNSAFNVATNQATATAATPGLTQIYASANGVFSSAFTQRAFPTLDFFETCPVQSITLQLGVAGSQSGQTSFNTTKGTTQPVTATVVDVFGNILSKVPLTWSSSEPAALSAGAGCSGQTCSIGTAQPGAGLVTASCSPPTCNVGFPLSPVPASLPLDFVPLPVYATTAISGLVNGTTTSTNVLASSLDCQGNHYCVTSLYNIATSNNLATNPTAMPAPPNSLMLDLAGDKAYAGSNYGAFLVATGSLGGTSNPFTSFGTVTGTVLAVSPNGNVALISDTVHTPNQVYVVNTSVASSPTTTALNISGATTAGFSPDGLKAFIIGCSASAGQCTNPDTIYVYSSLQSLQTITLPPLSSANEVAFSANGAFAYVSYSSNSGANFAVNVYNTCNNLIAHDNQAQAQTIPLQVNPLFLKILPDGMHIIALGSSGFDLITAISTVQTPTLTNPPTATESCPQFVSNTDGVLTIPSVQHVNLGQGTFNPVAFFVSPDATQAYIVASDRSDILVYNFNTGSVSGIPLAGNATPGDPANPMRTVADITVDGTLIYVAGSDGALHEVSTNPAVDLVQISFPNLPNFSNPFCSIGNCKLNVVAVRP